MAAASGAGADAAAAPEEKKLLAMMVEHKFPWGKVVLNLGNFPLDELHRVKRDIGEVLRLPLDDFRLRLTPLDFTPRVEVFGGDYTRIRIKCDEYDIEHKMARGDMKPFLTQVQKAARDGLLDQKQRQLQSMVVQRAELVATIEQLTKDRSLWQEKISILEDEKVHFEMSLEEVEQRLCERKQQLKDDEERFEAITNAIGSLEKEDS